MVGYEATLRRINDDLQLFPKIQGATVRGVDNYRVNDANLVAGDLYFPSCHYLTTAFKETGHCSLRNCPGQDRPEQVRPEQVVEP